MALTDFLNETDFYAYAGLSTTDVNSAYVSALITRINGLVDQKLCQVFALTPNQTFKYYPTVAEGIIPIANWQETDLVVRLGRDGSTTLRDLTVGQDFRYFFFRDPEPNRTYPVVAVKLYNDYLAPDEFLEIEGTYGFSDGVPPELMLDIVLYDLLKKGVLNASTETDTGGSGVIQSSRIDKVAVSFGSTTDTSVTARDLTIPRLIQAVTDTLDAIVLNYQINDRYLPSIVG